MEWGSRSHSRNRTDTDSPSHSSPAIQTPTVYTDRRSNPIEPYTHQTTASHVHHVCKEGMQAKVCPLTAVRKSKRGLGCLPACYFPGMVHAHMYIHHFTPSCVVNELLSSMHTPTHAATDDSRLSCVRMESSLHAHSPFTGPQQLRTRSGVGAGHVVSGGVG